MYPWIWRRLPGRLSGKIVGLLLLITVVIALLWFVVFPWVQRLLPFDDVTVN